MMKITLKNVLKFCMIKCETVSRKPCINIEDKSKSSQFSYKSIVVTIKIQFLSVVTPPYIYHFCVPQCCKRCCDKVKGV